MTLGPCFVISRSEVRVLSPAPFIRVLVVVVTNDLLKFFRNSFVAIGLFPLTGCGSAVAASVAELRES